MLSPWEDPIPLKRAWCLWEVLCTINGNVPLTVQLPPKELASFEEALKTGRVHLVSRAMSNIDVRQSDAHKKADKDMILAAVEARLDACTQRLIEADALPVHETHTLLT